MISNSTISQSVPSSPRHLTIGQSIFSEEYLLDLARTSGFLKRAPRKIDACGLLASICAECLNGSPSYNDLAASMEASRPDCGPSRQAIGLRLGESFETFIERLLGDVVAHRLTRGDARPEDLAERFCGYRRVLVQDSTVIKLPSHLFAEFSGVSNGQSSVCNARIQATYELISSRLVGFSIDPYSKNDLAAAPELAIQEGDLVLRDRGYLTTEEVRRHCAAGAAHNLRHQHPARPTGGVAATQIRTQPQSAQVYEVSLRRSNQLPARAPLAPDG